MGYLTKWTYLNLLVYHAWLYYLPQCLTNVNFILILVHDICWNNFYITKYSRDWITWSAIGNKKQLKSHLVRVTKRFEFTEFELVRFSYIRMTRFSLGTCQASISTYHLFLRCQPLKVDKAEKKMVEIASCSSYWEVWVHLVWISEVLLYQDDNMFFRNTSGQYFYLSFVSEMPATNSRQSSCQIAVLDWNKFYLHPVLYPWLATNYLENTYDNISWDLSIK